MKNYSERILLLKDTIVNEYLNNENVSYCSIANKYKINKKTVARILKNEKVVIKGNKKMDAKKPSPKADMKMDKALAKKVMYKKAGRGK